MAPRMPKAGEAERLIATPDFERPGRFSARLASTGEEIVSSSRQPLVDGARELLARGFDPAMPLTKWTYAERDRGIAVERWQPRQPTAEGQKAGSEAPVVPNPHPEANSLPRSPTDGGQPHPATRLGQAA